jgi:phage terminase Nu1 subunit (DNA packaging protein)
MNKQYFDIIELAEIFNVRRHIIVGWVNRGCPVVQKSDRTKRQEWQFDLAEVIRWREEQSRSVFSPQEPVTSRVDAEDEQTRIEKAQRRKAVAEAEIAELQLAKARGDLLDKGKVRQILLDLAQRDQAAWHRWAFRVAKQLAAELGVDAERAHHVLDRYIRQHLRELAQTGYDL